MNEKILCSERKCKHNADGICQKDDMSVGMNGAFVSGSCAEYEEQESDTKCGLI